MQRVEPPPATPAYDRRHQDYCSLFLDAEHDTAKDPVKETCFIIPTDLYQTPIFCKKHGVCIEKLIAIMKVALGNGGKEAYLGLAIQLLLRAFTHSITQFMTDTTRKAEFLRLVDKLEKEISSHTATGPYLPKGIWTIKFVSAVEEGGILVRVHYDPRVFDFMLNPVEEPDPFKDIPPCMSPTSFFQ